MKFVKEQGIKIRITEFSFDGETEIIEEPRWYCYHCNEKLVKLLTSVSFLIGRYHLNFIGFSKINCQPMFEYQDGLLESEIQFNQIQNDDNTIIIKFDEFSVFDLLDINGKRYLPRIHY